MLVLLIATLDQLMSIERIEESGVDCWSNSFIIMIKNCHDCYRKLSIAYKENERSNNPYITKTHTNTQSQVTCTFLSRKYDPKHVESTCHPLPHCHSLHGRIAYSQIPPPSEQSAERERLPINTPISIHWKSRLSLDNRSTVLVLLSK